MYNIRVIRSAPPFVVGVWVNSGSHSNSKAGHCWQVEAICKVQEEYCCTKTNNGESDAKTGISGPEQLRAVTGVSSYNLQETP